MEILYSVYNSLSSRELASITIVSVFLVYVLQYSNVRKSIWECQYCPKRFFRSQCTLLILNCL